MKQMKKNNQGWVLASILLLGVLGFSIFAEAGTFLLGAPGVLISDMMVDGGASCFKQGDTLIISGHGFGSEGDGYVIAYATQGPMPIKSWADTEIRFRVPTVAEAPRFFPQGGTLMIIHGKDQTPTALYTHGPVFCDRNK